MSVQTRNHRKPRTTYMAINIISIKIIFKNRSRPASYRTDRVKERDVRWSLLYPPLPVLIPFNSCCSLYLSLIALFTSMISSRKRRRNYPLDPCLGFYSSKDASQDVLLSKKDNNTNICTSPYQPTRHASPIFAYTCPTPSPAPPHSAQSTKQNLSRKVSAASMTSKRSSSPHLTVEGFLRRSTVNAKKGLTRNTRKRRRLAKADSSSEPDMPTGFAIRGKKRRKQPVPPSVLSYEAIPPEFARAHEPHKSNIVTESYAPKVPTALHVVSVDDLNEEIPFVTRKRKSRNRIRFRPSSQPNILDAFNPLNSDATVEEFESASSEIRPMSHWRIPFYTAKNAVIAAEAQDVPTPLQLVDWIQHEESLSALRDGRNRVDNHSTNKAQGFGNNDSNQRIPLSFMPLNDPAYPKSISHHLISSKSVGSTDQLQYGLYSPLPQVDMPFATRMPNDLSVDSSASSNGSSFDPTSHLCIAPTLGGNTADNPQLSEQCISPRHPSKAALSPSGRVSSNSRMVQKSMVPLTSLKSFQSAVPNLIAAAQAVSSRHQSEKRSAVVGAAPLNGPASFAYKTARIGFRQIAKPSKQEIDVADFLEEQDIDMSSTPSQTLSKTHCDDQMDPAPPFPAHNEDEVMISFGESLGFPVTPIHEDNLESNSLPSNPSQQSFRLNNPWLRCSSRSSAIFDNTVLAFDTPTRCSVK
ncbi:hypothetical protein M422DRAFT_44247 [Sphaerobolus stellatus SS14]|nr:hypothetical protein M422DRAFT_44247 [Sphaerobolus stellatus SS14]